MKYIEREKIRFYGIMKNVGDMVRYQSVLEEAPIKYITQDPFEHIQSYVKNYKLLQYVTN